MDASSRSYFSWILMRPGGLETSRAKIKRDTCLNIYIYIICVSASKLLVQVVFVLN